MKRDTYIDVVRGAAALSIIAIHTACKSGAAYVPGWFLGLMLMVDVPVFFFLSGWGAGFRPGALGKTVVSLGKLWLKWAAFVCVLTLCCRLTGLDGARSFEEWYESLFFRVTFRSLPVINESVWFFPVYIRVLLLGQLALCLIHLCADRQGKRPDEGYMLLLAVLGVAYLGLNAGYELIPGLDMQVVFYAMVWLAGLCAGCKNLSIHSWKVLAACVAICIAGWWMAQRGLNTAWLPQDVKFPPRLAYLFISGIALSVILFLRGRVSATGRLALTLAHIGRNAMYYFMMQGVMSSVLYWLLPYFQWETWFAQWLVFFGINVAGTAVLAEGFAAGYRMLERWAAGLWKNHMQKP